jgi:type II secretory ATPase GspE/PulE/Tfp pilus assembly ATPase PilB-like protein
MEALGLPGSWRKDPKLGFFRPKGCPACDYIGYMGRVGLFELLLVDEHVCDMIQARAMAYEIRAYARKTKGMRTLREEGLVKCINGITSPEEILLHTDRYDDD